ncbi:MAG: mechanosensitive ion channel family protein [Acidimicrobiales bacterium]
MLLAATTSDQVIAATTVVVGVAFAFAVNRAVRAAGRRTKTQGTAMTVAGRVLSILILAIATFTALSQLGVQIGPLLGALGIGGAVVALSLQPVLGNLVGAAMIHARRPIRPGDQIDSNGVTGTVLDVNGRAVVILTHDGTTAYVPNLKILDEPLENFTRDPSRRTCLAVEVDYRTDLRQAQQVLTRAVAGVEGVDLPVAALVRSFEASGVLMELRFWHPSEELEASWIVSEVAIAAREALADVGIDIAFPQTVVHVADDSPALPITRPDITDSREDPPGEKRV